MVISITINVWPDKLAGDAGHFRYGLHPTEWNSIPSRDSRPANAQFFGQGIAGANTFKDFR